LLHVISKLK